jgi:hypothetical protein
MICRLKSDWNNAMLRINSLALCVLLASTPPLGAQVVTDHLLGKYSATDDGCQSGATPEYEIRRGIVEGPDIFCILGATKPTDTGTEAYETRCRLADGVKLGTLTFDLSKKPEYIRIMLPGSRDWLTLYVCK